MIGLLAGIGAGLAALTTPPHTPPKPPATIAAVVIVRAATAPTPANPGYNGSPCGECFGPNDFVWLRDEKGFCLMADPRTAALNPTFTDTTCGINP